MLEKIRNTVSVFIYIISHFVVFFLSKIFLSVYINYEDKDFKEIKRPVIIVSNHKNSFDAWVILYSLPFRVFFRILPIRAFAKKRFEKSFLWDKLYRLKIIDFVYYIYNVITIPEVDSFEGKTKPLVEALNNKNSILMFPEGRIILEEGVGEFKKGVVYLQDMTGTPILPCAVCYGKKTFFRRKTSVSFGKAFYTPKELLKNKENYLEAREYLRKEILRLYNKNNVR